MYHLARTMRANIMGSGKSRTCSMVGVGNSHRNVAEEEMAKRPNDWKVVGHSVGGEGFITKGTESWKHVKRAVRGDLGRPRAPACRKLSRQLDGTP